MASDLPRNTFRSRMTRLLELARAYAQVRTQRNRITRLIEMMETTVVMAKDQEDGWLFLGEGPRYEFWLREYPKAAQCLCVTLLVIRDILVLTDTRKQALCPSIVAEAKRLGLPRLIRKCAGLAP